MLEKKSLSHVRMAALIWKIALCHSWCTVPCCPFNKGDFIGSALPYSSPFAHNEVSCTNTDFLYKYHDPGFQWNNILVLSIYQANSVDDLTCTALVMGWLGFPQLEPLPRSAANFKISNSSCFLWWMFVQSILATFTALLHHTLISTFCHIPCTKLSGFS